MKLPLQLLSLFSLVSLGYALEPRSDPEDFYTPPAGYEQSAPGTVLKSRTIEPALFGIFPQFLSFETYQLLYRSTAVDGKPIATVTTVFVPRDAAKDRMVAYDVFEDSTAAKCAPSRNFQLDGTATNMLVQTGIQILQAYLLKNWVVSVADDEGPDSAFGAGRMAGMIVLDGIRAVKSFSPIGLQDDAMVVGSGYSGGAIGTGWAAGLKKKYANELNVVGWALGGNPANLTGTFVNIDGTFAAGLIPTVMAGLAKPSAYPDLQTLIDQVATPEGKASLDYVNSHCGNDDIRHFQFKRFQTTDFSSLGDQILRHPQVVKILGDNLMGKNADETPQAPIFLYQSKLDKVINIEDVRALSDTWCKNGAKVQFNTYLESGHGSLAIRALRDVLHFIRVHLTRRLPRHAFKRQFSPHSSPYRLAWSLSSSDSSIFYTITDKEETWASRVIKVQH